MESSFDWILQNPGLNHLTIKIFKLLDINSLGFCLVVSKQWHQFIKENETIWKAHVSTELPLHDVCNSGYVNMVKLFIDLNYDINAKNRLDQTPLYLACQQNQVKLVELLCQQPGVDVN